MFYWNTIEQLFLFVEQLYQLEVCLLYNRLLTGITIVAVFQNLKWNSNKTSLIYYPNQEESCNRTLIPIGGSWFLCLHQQQKAGDSNDKSHLRLEIRFYDEYYRKQIELLFLINSLYYFQVSF